MESKRQSDAEAETVTLDVPGPTVEPSDEEKQVAYAPPQIPDGGVTAWSTVSTSTSLSYYES